MPWRLRLTQPPKDHTLDDFQTALSDATADDMEPVAGPEAEDHVSSPLVASGQATSIRADTLTTW